MAGVLSNALALSILEHLGGIATWTAPSSLYLALSTTDPLQDGSGITEPTGNNYSRTSIAPGGTNWQYSSRVLSNKLTVTCPTASGNWGQIYFTALYTASTSGTYLASGGLLSSPCPFSADEGSAGAISKFVTSGGGGIFANGTQVVLQGLALPTGVVAGTTYYIINSSTDNNEFQLSATSGGSAIALSSDGYGIIGVDLSQTIHSGGTISFSAGQLSYTLN